MEDLVLRELLSLLVDRDMVGGGEIVEPLDDLVGHLANDVVEERAICLLTLVDEVLKRLEEGLHDHVQARARNVHLDVIYLEYQRMVNGLQE